MFNDVGLLSKKNFLMEVVAHVFVPNTLEKRIQFTSQKKKKIQTQNHAIITEYSKLESSSILDPRHKMSFKIGH